MYILHLSDLHFGTAEEADLWYGQLSEDLKQELNSSQLDAIILSGDIANKSVPEEYHAAQCFLKKVSEEFQLSPEQIVIVPGNHDLNWELSKNAYKEDDSNRDEEKHRKRFLHFANFYKSIKGEIYPPEYEKQDIFHHFPKQNLLILGLNSAWRLDHKNTSDASINSIALNDALNQIRNEKRYMKCLKIAVWHHPLKSSGEDRIKDMGFMERLAVAGFRLALHGHIHKADNDLYLYDRNIKGRKIDIIVAGTFGAPIGGWVPGYPLQYNLLKLEKNKLRVETRRREEINGAWKPDARWQLGPKQNPLPYYEIDLRDSIWREILNNIKFLLTMTITVYIICYVTALSIYHYEDFRVTSVKDEFKDEFKIADYKSVKSLIEKIPSLQKIKFSQKPEIYDPLSIFHSLSSETVINQEWVEYLKQLAVKNKRYLNNIKLEGIDLSGTDLSEANLMNTNLINAVLENTIFYKADLRQADLTEAKLKKAKLISADLRQADLTEARLTGADLSNAKLCKDNELSRAADLSKAILTKAILRDTNLRGADLYDADLSGATLIGTDLTDADLRQADLREANLSGAIFRGAKLDKAVIAFAKEWNIEQLSKAQRLFKINCENHPECEKYIQELKDKCPQLFNNPALKNSSANEECSLY